jgi:hypothetical protein
MADAGSKSHHEIEEHLHRHIGEAIETAAGKLREKLHSSVTSLLHDVLSRSHSTASASHSGDDVWTEWLGLVLGASDASSALQALLDGAAAFGRRAAIFVVRGEYAICWQAAGMHASDPVPLTGNSALANAFRSTIVQWGSPRNLPALNAVRVSSQPDAGDSGSSVGGMYPIIVRGKPIAVLHWDAAGSSDFAAERRVWLLVQITAMAVERLLTQTNRGAASIPAPAEQPRAMAAVSAAASPVVASMPKLTTATSSDQSGLERRARRFAKVLVEDLELYVQRDRPGTLDEGRRHRDLYSRLRDDLEKARKSFLEKFPPGSAVGPEILDEEIVRVLAKGEPGAMGAGFQSAGGTRAQAAAATASATPQLEARAKRYAKVLVEDLELYLQRDRPKKLSDARQQHDVYRGLKDDIERCRQSFVEKFPPDSGVPLSLLEQEIIRVLCRGDRTLLGRYYSGL